MIKITELAIGQRFRTTVSKREGSLMEVRGFKEDPKEIQYWVRFDDGKAPSPKEVHPDLLVEPL